MMSAAHCRAKAAAWSARADIAPESEFERRLERIAHNWAALAEKAEAHEALERKAAVVRALS